MAIATATLDRAEQLVSRLLKKLHGIEEQLIYIGTALEEEVMQPIEDARDAARPHAPAEAPPPAAKPAAIGRTTRSVRVYVGDSRQSIERRLRWKEKPYVNYHGQDFAVLERPDGALFIEAAFVGF